MKSEKYHSRHSFFLAREKTFSVEMICWSWPDGEWAWNVYAHVFEGHPLFSETDRLMTNAPLHGGCTFDQRVVRAPINGIKYEWQRETTTLTIGSDYKHCGSPDLSNYGPFDEIPWIVKRDAQELCEYLSEVVAAEDSEVEESA